MKAIIFGYFILISVAQKQCSKAANSQIPACIQSRIEAIKQQPRWNPPADVTEYRYGGKRVFLFSSNCCDQYNEVLDEKCNYVCAPSGGMTGEGDRKCTGFSENAQLIKVVWKDERQ
jgi:hypothetical protein